MRVIDADELIMHLSDCALQVAPTDNDSPGDRWLAKKAYNLVDNCIKVVEEQPTVTQTVKIVMAREERW